MHRKAISGTANNMKLQKIFLLSTLMVSQDHENLKRQQDAKGILNLAQDFAGTLIKLSDDHKELVPGKCLLITALFPFTPAFLGRSLKSGYVFTSACHEPTCSLIPLGRVPVLL